ncbi:MAG: alpha/beta hydrolase family protein, partial [Myxococcota bacterium]
QQVQAPVATVGFSMGGHLAAGVAATLPGETPLVVAAPPLCPSEPFTDGPLSVCVNWDALGGDTAENRDRWRTLMDRFDLRNLPRPGRPAAIRVIGCRHDGLVPPSHTEQISERWGVPVAWHDVGHVAVPISNSALVRAGVREVLGLPAKGRSPELLSAPNAARRGV